MNIPTEIEPSGYDKVIRITIESIEGNRKTKITREFLHQPQEGLASYGSCVGGEIALAIGAIENDLTWNDMTDLIQAVEFGLSELSGERDELVS